MKLQEQITRVQEVMGVINETSETYELPKRTPLEKVITKFVEDELDGYDLPSNFYGVVVDIIDDNKICEITALFKKSYRMNDSDKLRAIMKRVIKECEAFFSGPIKFKSSGTSTIGNYLQGYSKYYQSKKNISNPPF